jgi:hypothetical protein
MTDKQIEDLKQGMEDYLAYDEAISVLCQRFLETNEKLIAIVETHPEWREFIQANFDSIEIVSKMGMERSKTMLGLADKMRKLGHE